MSKERLSKLREKLVEEEAQAILVEKPENIQYLSGFTGSEAIGIISEDEAVLLIDFRYFEQACSEALHFKVELYKEKKLNKLGAILEKTSAETIGFEAHYQSYEMHQQLIEKISQMKYQPRMKPLVRAIEQLRAVKEDSEISSISEATKVNDAAFIHILPFIKEGTRESDIALELEFFVRKRGAESVGFDIIVASGANSSMPHARTSDKKIKAGDFVKMDWGAVFEGYHSDVTRTVIMGKASEKQKKIYEMVLRVHELALESITAGKSGKEIDQIARDCFKKSGYEEEFGHNLGHGVGLEIHELPVLGPRSKDVLIENMVATVEPGLYFPGFGGVRIEDLVVIRKDKAHVLTRAPKELIEI